MAETCYRHPGRETGVSCSACGRPICPECMTSTPVGMRCPECAKERTRVSVGVAGGSSDPVATYALIAMSVLAYVAQTLGGSGGDKVLVDAGICANAISDTGGLCGLRGSGGSTVILSQGNEVWRVVTGAFLHGSPFHLLLNMVALYFLGSLLEPAIGRVRFLGIYLAGLMAGSFGALLLSNGPDITIGASGAVFGLMAAAFVIARHRGVNELAGQIGIFVVLNLVFTFSIPGISIGGHIGGLIGGGLAAILISQVERRAQGTTARVIEVGGVAVIVIASLAGALLAAGASADAPMALPL